MFGMIKKTIRILVCLVIIMLAMAACGETATVETTQETTIAREPVDVLTEAGLSQELIDTYFNLVDVYKLKITAGDFVKVANLGEELMWGYFYTYGQYCSADEYIQTVDELREDGFTQDQILGYKNYPDLNLNEYVDIIKKMKDANFSERQIYEYYSFKDQYTPEQYIQLINDLKNAGLSEDQIDMYSVYTNIKPEKYVYICTNFEDFNEVISNHDFFSEKYSLEEYLDLIAKLREETSEASAMPIYPLSDNLVFVKRNISTYDYVEESIAIMTIAGELVTDWNVDWGDYDIQYRAKCGEYFFIITKAHIYNYYNCDVVNKEGKIIANIYCKENRYDIGGGYVFYSLGADYGQIMNPMGEIIELQTASVHPSYGEKSDGSLGEDQEIGKLSDGLFYGYSDGNMNTVAYYYNTQGEVVIDLSTRAVNFKVTKLYDFENGQAKIEFRGADYKYYSVFIDKTGAFIGEPTEMVE